MHEERRAGRRVAVTDRDLGAAGGPEEDQVRTGQPAGVREELGQLTAPVAPDRGPAALARPVDLDEHGVAGR